MPLSSDDLRPQRRQPEHQPEQVANTPQGKPPAGVAYRVTFLSSDELPLPNAVKDVLAREFIQTAGGEVIVEEVDI